MSEDERRDEYDDTDDGWVSLAGYPSSQRAAATIALLTEARIPARLEPFCERGQGPSHWGVEVPAREREVAFELLARLCDDHSWAPEGDADEAEILAAMDEPFPEVEEQRRHDADGGRSSQWIGVALAIALVVVIVLLIASLLVGS